MTQTLINFDVQRREIARVEGKIGLSVLRFCRAHIGQTFTALELRDHVSAEFPTAPASADRILRQLRRKGVVEYSIVSRPNSLYRVEGVK